MNDIIDDAKIILVCNVLKQCIFNSKQLLYEEKSFI